MLTVNFWNFSKRKNSTARPASLAAALSVALKENTSIDRPVFKLSAASFDYNYCKWDNRYYFVTDIISERNNGWSVSCELDEAATYRTEILATTAFVEYADDGNLNLTDNRIVPEGISPTAATANAQIPISVAGTYLLSAVGEGKGVRQFCLGKTGMNLILNAIDQWYNSAVVAGNELEIIAKNFISSGDAMSCVRECRWVPFDVATLDGGGGTDELILGQFHTGQNFHWLGDLIKAYTYTVTIPFSRAGWLRLPPYTDVSVFLPFVGVVSLNHPIFSTNDSLVVEMSINLSSGDIAYELKCGGVTLGSYGASTAVSIPVGISNISPSSIFNSVAGAAASLAYGNIVGAAGAVMSAFQATQTTVGGISGGAGAGLEDYITVSVVERSVSDAVGAMRSVQGIPLFATRALSSLSGFVKTRGASVSGALHGDQYDTVNQMLDTGIFLE